MIRQIIKIDEEKCNGCGLCVSACHEGAIGLINGKARLMRDDYCDGLGDCLPACPTGAITLEKREAVEYNEAEVRINMKPHADIPLPCGCPGTQSRTLGRPAPDARPIEAQQRPSELRQWPCQLKLVPAKAPYFNEAHLLVAADCTAFAFGDFHSYMRGRVTLIGCPKLDSVDYSEKLATIIKDNDIRSVTVALMEVPCCNGLGNAVMNALKASEKMIPWRIITISTDGRILEDLA
jgi:NAD-dependent dihydropyrimidine dehydrogenase PreA subunit